MFVQFGEGLYGRCERLPDGSYVATCFLNIYWIPIAPSYSYLVLEERRSIPIVRDGWYKGVRIPLSARSIVLTYARSISVLAGLFCAPALSFAWKQATAIPGRSTVSNELVALTTLYAVGLVALWALGRFVCRRRILYERAIELAWRAARPDATFDEIDVAYGRTRHERDMIVRRWDSSLEKRTPVEHTRR